MNVSGSKVAKSLGVASLGLFAAGLVFRFAIYRHMYLASGDPYGISDIIEFLLGWALIVVLGASVSVALVLGVKGPRSNRVGAAWLLGVCVLVVALLKPLHTLAARWAI
jgi:hypothetical protein